MKYSTTALTLLTFALTACGSGDGEANAASDAAPVLSSTADASLPSILVYKTASCGCCNGWVEHLQEAGFNVEARNVSDLMSVKRDAGVPVAMSSCHTAIIDGYTVEGHVPADQIKRMLAERPDIVGIGAPGMPAGSPGMESSNAKPYQVLQWDREGNAAVYAEIDPG
jgi:hypothetical protein